MKERESIEESPAVSSSKRQTGRAIRASWAALIVLVLLIGIHFARRSGVAPEAYSNDFNVYYHASREVLAGRDPYQHSLGEWTPYLYPPLLAELIIPLALLPLPLAAYVWFLIGAASVAASAWMSTALAVENQQVVSRSKSQIAIAACGLLIVVRFALDNFSLGQVNPLMTALVVAHVYLYARGKKTLSSIALAMAISIKLTPSLLLVYHLARRRIRFTAGTVALLLLTTAASLLPMGAAAPGVFGTFIRRTLQNEQGYNLADPGNQSLRGAIARLDPGDVDEARSRAPASPLSLLLAAALLLVAIAAGVRANGELAAVAPFVCCIILLSPLAWKAHFVLLIAPLVSLLARLWSSTNGRRALIAAALLAAFVMFNVTSPRVIGVAAAEWCDRHSLVFAGGLLIFLISVAQSLSAKFGNQPRLC